MPRVALAALAAACALAATAGPAAADVHRVVLLDAAPELVHATETALAPWRIEVVATRADGPADTATAARLGVARGADRVAWIDHRELVVLDPATGISERRPASGDPADPASAAAIALSLKTALRLPPPPDASPAGPAPPPIAIVTPAPAPAPRGLALVPTARAGVRVPFDGTLGAHARFDLGVGVALTRLPRLLAGLYVGLGPTTDRIGRAGFDGTWSDLELGVRAEVAIGLGRALAVVPGAWAAGHRLHVTGKVAPDTLDERTTVVELGLGVGLRWRAGRLTLGAAVGVGLWPGSPTYERGNVTVFDSPGVTGQVAATLAVEI